MNWDQAKGNWKQFKVKAQQQCGRQAEDGLAMVVDRVEELVDRAAA